MPWLRTRASIPIGIAVSARLLQPRKGKRLHYGLATIPFASPIERSRASRCPHREALPRG